MIVAIIVALASAASYGISDFCGGISSGRMGVAPTSLTAYGLSTVTAAVALVFAGGHWTAAAVLWGSLSGLLAVGGTLAFYAALVAGPISIGTPIVGTLESAVPVVAAVLLGQRLTWLGWLAIVLAAAGGALVSLRFGTGERMTARAGILAVVGGILFGGSILALNRAPHDAGLVPAVFIGAVGLVVMLLMLAVSRLSRRWRLAIRRLDAGATAVSRSTRPLDWRRVRELGRPHGIRRMYPAVLTGVLMGGGNALLVIALRLGPLAVVSVLADLYPVAAVLLAWSILRERLSVVQFTGVGLAIAASALFAVG